MVRPLSDLIKDADNIIFGRPSSQEKTAGKAEADLTEADIFKLAEQIRKAPEAPVVEKRAAKADEIDFTLREKVAHAIALVDTLLNLPTLQKVAEFEESARAAGYTSAQIQAELEKTASIKFRSVLDEMPWLQPEG